jgi:hypothetical protein
VVGYYFWGISALLAGDPRANAHYIELQKEGVARRVEDVLV